MSLREDVVFAARNELGRRRQPQYDESALGPGVHDRPAHWCGIFALYCLHEAGLARDICWQIGGGFVRENPQAFPVTISPHPGDIGVQTHPPWHHVLVAERSGNLLTTIAGNTGPSPGVVGESTASVADPGWCWYSIEPVEAVP